MSSSLTFLFLFVIVLVVGALLLLLDPRRNARIFMRKHSDERSGWDKVDKYDPEARQRILDLMIQKELSGDKDWPRMYKSVLDREGITELEVKRAIAREMKETDDDNPSATSS